MPESITEPGAYSQLTLSRCLDSVLTLLRWHLPQCRASVQTGSNADGSLSAADFATLQSAITADAADASFVPAS